MQLQPYLFFNGRCEEAVEFYRKALGAEVDMDVRIGLRRTTRRCEDASSSWRGKGRIAHDSSEWALPKDIVQSTQHKETLQ